MPFLFLLQFCAPSSAPAKISLHPDTVVTDLGRFSAGMLERLARVDLVSIRQLAFLDDDELASFTGAGAADVRAVTELLIAAGLARGRHPFCELSLAARLALGRAGVWSLGDLDRTKWVERSRRTKDHYTTLAILSRLVRNYGVHPLNVRRLDLDIELVPMHRQVRAALRTYGLHTLREISLLSKKELTYVPGLGARGRETVTLLIEEGLTTLGTSPFMELDEHDRRGLAALKIWSMRELVDRWDEVIATKIYARHQPELDRINFIATAMDTPILPVVERPHAHPDVDRALLQILDGLAALHDLAEADELRSDLRASGSARGRLRMVRASLEVLDECDRLLRKR